MRHKHADLIIAWANGARIQYLDGKFWCEIDSPNWDESTEYRVRPRSTKELQQDCVRELRFLQTSDDPESAHCQADDILCEFLSELGYEDVVEEYSKITKWYA